MQHQPEDRTEEAAPFDPDLPGNLEIDPEDLRPRPIVLPERRRVLMVVAILLLLVGLVLLPPLISANRFRRRIAQSVSESLGRPVHIDSVALTLLPMPGFTLENFVVSEDPAFGSEPVIQARSVRVALRVPSLWRRRVEFSRISLDEPSVNLVHRADGRWNIESILLSAARIDAAPTAQTRASNAPRFPYIEASGARINVKMGLEKMPLALTEADLALWLPEPNQWRLRLEGHPTRTDNSPTDTGTVRIQGTLGKAASIADVPVDLAADWRDAPLGGVSFVLLGRDAGFRGALALRTSVKGTLGRNAVEAHADITDLRRADFVPARTLEAHATCTARTDGLFHHLADIHCALPADSASGLLLEGELPDVTRPSGFSGTATLSKVRMGWLADALRMSSNRIAPDLAITGLLSGTLTCCAGGNAGWLSTQGTLSASAVRLQLGKSEPFVDDDPEATVAGGAILIHPFALDLGGPQPAQLSARIDPAGVSTHLTGAFSRERLLEFAHALPAFGDGLPEAVPQDATHLDLTSTRTWFTGQTWTPSAAPTPKPRPRKR